MIPLHKGFSLWERARRAENAYSREWEAVSKLTKEVFVVALLSDIIQYPFFYLVLKVAQNNESKAFGCCDNRDNWMFD